MTNLAALSVDELADGICLRAARIAAAQAELLLWIGEFDRREGWAGPGMLSCAHWLSWRTGLSLGTARDQVRVARRLPELPQHRRRLRRRQPSCSKVRAITRVADAEEGRHDGHVVAAPAPRVLAGPSCGIARAGSYRGRATEDAALGAARPPCRWRAASLTVAVANSCVYVTSDGGAVRTRRCRVRPQRMRCSSMRAPDGRGRSSGCHR